MMSLCGHQVVPPSFMWSITWLADDEMFEYEDESTSVNRERLLIKYILEI